MKIVFQRQALEEYRDAAAYIAQDPEQNACLLIQRVEAALAYIRRTRTPTSVAVTAR